jgi:hypothetical protein
LWCSYLHHSGPAIRSLLLCSAERDGMKHFRAAIPEDKIVDLDDRLVGCHASNSTIVAE